MKEKILIIDDNREIINLVTDILKREGYSVICAETTEEGLEKVERSEPDLILLDVKIPTIGGLEVCRILKSDEKTRKIPVIMLTVQSSSIEKVMGLEIGADDYITKPFDEKELLARIKAMLRRMGYDEKIDEILKSGDITINIEERKVLIGDKAIKLRPKEYDLLVLFVKKKNKVLNRNYLMENIWGFEYFGTNRAVDTAIKRLRKALGEYAEKIETIPSVGYKFIED